MLLSAGFLFPNIYIWVTVVARRLCHTANDIKQGLRVRLCGPGGATRRSRRVVYDARVRRFGGGCGQELGRNGDSNDYHATPVLTPTSFGGRRAQNGFLLEQPKQRKGEAEMYQNVMPFWLQASLFLFPPTLFANPPAFLTSAECRDYPCRRWRRS